LPEIDYRAVARGAASSGAGKLAFTLLSALLCVGGWNTYTQSGLEERVENTIQEAVDSQLEPALRRQLADVVAEAVAPLRAEIREQGRGLENLADARASDQARIDRLESEAIERDRNQIEWSNRWAADEQRQGEILEILRWFQGQAPSWFAPAPS
jgi:hypothetical protein